MLGLDATKVIKNNADEGIIKTNLNLPGIQIE